GDAADHRLRSLLGPRGPFRLVQQLPRRVHHTNLDIGSAEIHTNVSFFHSPRSPVLMDFFPFIRHGTFLVKVGHLLSLERYSTRAPLLLRRRRHTAPPMPRGDPSRKTPRRR